jgi:Fe-S cluster assembly protein SufD
MLDFKIKSNEVSKIGNFNAKEKEFRLQNLDNFNRNGFPNKRSEDWKFSDLREIVSKNFKKLDLKSVKNDVQTVDFIKEFDHNFIIIINGELTSSSFKFEEKNKIKVQTYQNNNFKKKQEDNPLISLNHALSDKGYFLEIEENYKFKKVLVIYNVYTNNLNENILNCKNKIKLGKNSELHTLEYIINHSKKNFFNNIYENVILEESASYKNISVHNEKSSGYFHKFSRNKLDKSSSYKCFIFPSGLKFNKLDLEFDLNGEKSECNLQAASYSDQDDHQEIKTRINHLAPNCRSFQKVKNVLNAESKGIYQGKIFVKDIAQKTDAYQLSKAILLNDNSEFNSKPELEIYADDVKCSHGSSSGSIDENSIFYLMSRGLSRKESLLLLINGFLSEVIDEIKNNKIKNFIASKLEKQLYGYKKH